MSQFQFGMPGVTPSVFTTDAELFWGGDESRMKILRDGARVSSAARDAGATVTTVLRKGLLLGMITATKRLKEWDPEATDGTSEIHSLLPVELNMLDSLSTAQDRFSPVVLQAPVKASAVRIKGSAMVGHTYEYLARSKMASQGFVFDDDPQGWLAGRSQRHAIKSADYTVVAADNGTLFMADTGNVNFTLPAIKAGLTYEFLRTTDHNLVVTSAEGDNIITVNDASADSITFSTASQKIGARVRITGIVIGATPKWLAQTLVAPGGTMTSTIAT